MTRTSPESTLRQRDSIYAQAQASVHDFAFNEAVVAVFPDMIARSVPGYSNVLAMTGMFAAQALGNGDRMLDLGCSLGASSYATLAYVPPADQITVVAIDSSSAMITAAQRQQADQRIEFQQGDILDADFRNAKAVLANYILQFVAPAQRLTLLQRIREDMHPDGRLLLSEKIEFADPDRQRFMAAAHLDFKRANGYSDLEISQKRTALENVMIVDTEDTHRARLQQAGFTRITKWFECLNWASFIIQP